jgi:hypothetical protein
VLNALICRQPYSCVSIRISVTGAISGLACRDPIARKALVERFRAEG